MRWWFFGISCTTLFWNQKESKKLETERRGSEVSKVSLKMTGIVRYKDVFADTLPAHDFRFLANPPKKNGEVTGGVSDGTSHPSWFQVICKTEKSDSDGDLSRMLYINMASNRQITQNHPGLVWVTGLLKCLCFWHFGDDGDVNPPQKKTYRFSAKRIGIRWPLKKQNRGPRACPNRA